MIKIQRKKTSDTKKTWKDIKQAQSKEVPISKLIAQAFLTLILLFPKAVGVQETFINASLINVT